MGYLANFMVYTLAMIGVIAIAPSAVQGNLSTLRLLILFQLRRERRYTLFQPAEKSFLLLVMSEIRH